MTNIVGHRQVLAELSREALLPAVTMLLGPEGTGKMSLAIEAAGYRGYLVHDTFVSRGPLQAEHLPGIQAFCRTAASHLSPQGKLVILCLDDCPAAVQSALLKLLEEPPPGVRFILVASDPPLTTVVSRSHVLRCGLLSDDEVEEVLNRLGHTGEEAREAACIAGGQVSIALIILRSAATAMKSVRAALRAASDRSPEALREAFYPISGASWNDEHHRALSRWAAEATSYRWHVFGPQDAPGLSKKDAQYVLTMLTALSPGRPWLTDRSILEQLALRPAG